MSSCILVKIGKSFPRVFLKTSLLRRSVFQSTLGKKFLSCTRSHEESSISSRLATLRSRNTRRSTVALFNLTRALMGLWIFHQLLGGGGCLNTPRLSRLLRIVEQNVKRRSKPREKSFRNHFSHFLAQVKIEVSRGQNSKNFKTVLDDEIFNFKGRATILIPSCLSRQGASNHV